MRFMSLTEITHSKSLIPELFKPTIKLKISAELKTPEQNSQNKEHHSFSIGNIINLAWKIRLISN